MNKEITEVLYKLQQEIRKDLWFFASCGVFIGMLMVWRFQLEERGIADGKSWPDALFGDFVSFHAFELLFLALLGLGAVAALVNKASIRWPRLENMVAHLESRLAQIVSVMMSFTLWVSISALMHSLFTSTLGGVELSVMILLFNGMIFIGFFSSALLARRPEPFNRLWSSILILLFALSMAIWLVVRGSN